MFNLAWDGRRFPNSWAVPREPDKTPTSRVNGTSHRISEDGNRFFLDTLHQITFDAREAVVLKPGPSRNFLTMYPLKHACRQTLISDPEPEDYGTFQHVTRSVGDTLFDTSFVRFVSLSAFFDFKFSTTFRGSVFVWTGWSGKLFNDICCGSRDHPSTGLHVSVKRFQRSVSPI